ncbi:hypothetical protein G5B46_08065 [Caulobacter sp. 602-2]|uniref:Uncharacterized protein n=1 Tax=Caulobacter sp. 602-2 TaxID=2710887 RepID=A0A6G4QX96_9CAUL|nr:hypothetical protein [Caulobacter sp. 602-2]NGM49558.1 hypothetical protein [Caulobacter sp. 602-2]
MSKPRITMTISDDGSFFELFLNEAGRSKLIRELQALNETDEHLHLDPDGIGDIIMSTKAYGDGQTVIGYGKIYLRKDEWDAEHYPHVLVSDE